MLGIRDALASPRLPCVGCVGVVGSCVVSSIVYTTIGLFIKLQAYIQGKLQIEFFFNIYNSYNHPTEKMVGLNN